MRKININLTYQNYKKLFKELYKITQVTKLRNFQYRLLLGKIYTNSMLYKWHLVDSTNCNLCENAYQDIVHLLVECPLVNPLWHMIEELFNINLTSVNIMENNPVKPIDSLENFIVLVCKQYIFLCKCTNEKPSVTKLRLEIYKWRNFDIYNARLNGTSLRMQAKWHNFKNVML